MAHNCRFSSFVMIVFVIVESPEEFNPIKTSGNNTGRPACFT